MDPKKIAALAVAVSLAAGCAYAQYSDYRSKRQMNVQPNMAPQGSAGVLKFGYEQATAVTPAQQQGQGFPVKTNIYTPSQLDLTSPSRDGILPPGPPAGQGSTSSGSEGGELLEGPNYGTDLEY